MNILPSWNEGSAKASIVDFVDRVTKEGGPDYIAPAERIDMSKDWKVVFPWHKSTSSPQCR